MSRPASGRAIGLLRDKGAVLGEGQVGWCLAVCRSPLRHTALLQYGLAGSCRAPVTSPESHDAGRGLKGAQARTGRAGALAAVTSPAMRCCGGKERGLGEG